MEKTSIEVPKVFVSYSHDGECHKEWVLKLSTDMRRHGVDVILDQWNLNIGKDLRFFMEEGLSETKFVICICSEEYVRKADAGIGGVGYETTIISSDMLKNAKTEYILPIIKNNDSNKKVPTFLSNKIYADFDNSDYFSSYLDLISTIHNVNIKEKPEIGNNPFTSGFIPSISKEIDLITDIACNQYNATKLKGIVEFNYSKNDGRFSIGTGNLTFETAWGSCSDDMIYAYSDYVDRVGYKDNGTIVPSLDELISFDFTSRAVKVRVGEVVIFKNAYGNFLAAKILDVRYKSRNGDNYFLKFQYEVLLD